MAKFLLLDKDGTLVRPVNPLSVFPSNPTDQALIEGVAGALGYYMDEGWVPVIISNQGGVAARHKSLKAAAAEMQYCMKLLPGIAFALFCPDYDATPAGPKSLGSQCFQVFPGDGDPVAIHEKFLDLTTGYRKPEPTMLTAALRLLNATDEDAVVMVGDRDEDAEAAAAAGLPFMLASGWRQEGLNIEFRIPT